MKKTHSANIGGTVFHIEEDAYEALQDYLQSIEAHFRFHPDVAEIIADIEGRIAELLLREATTGQVVRMADVQRVIAAMGTIEQFDDEVGATPPPAGSSEPRRLFRDPDQKVIAGVASGLASFVGLPPLLVRLLFIALLPFFGTAVVIYLLLWALVPMARTTTDKLQMRGRPLTLASIDRDLRDGIAAALRPATRDFAARSVAGAGSLIHQLVTGLVRMVRRAAGFFVVALTSLGILALSALLVMALVDAGMVPPVAEFFAAFGAQQVAFKVFVWLLAVIPLALILVAALRLFLDVTRFNARGMAALLGVWVIALLATVGIWSSNYPQLREFWSDYPARAEARQNVERLRTLMATTSPLTDAQAEALLATMTAEHKRRRNEAPFLARNWQDRRSRLQMRSELLTAQQESHRRIIAAAQAYLDPQQLADMENTLARHLAREQASLEALRERVERGGG